MRRRRLIPRVDYQLLLVSGVVATCLIFIVIAITGLQIEEGTFIAVLLNSLIAGLLLNEAHEERVEQRRPFVVVEIRDPDSSMVGATVDRPTPRLYVRNLGNGAATSVRVEFNWKLEDRAGKSLAQNPMLANGIPYLGPGTGLYIYLEKNFWFEIGVFPQIPYQPGTTPPPQQLALVDVTTRYTDLVTKREYSESFKLDAAPEVFGWHWEAK
jgi:hypothetical protein